MEKLQQHYVVALSTSEETYPRMQMCFPTLLLNSEKQVRNFVGQCDYYMSDIEISEEMHKHLDKCGCPADNRLFIADYEDSAHSVSIRLKQMQLAELQAELTRTKSE
ncbi:hypothetical protein [Rhizobium sp. RU20A]|uniref:hypothetical protein n=1 Tax=Rhizobium sp. RU20A TaxID=1907412 RepID=UPI00122D06E3|nr:hypothetical protein [Rhizobium sp. RU20A]